MRSEVVKIKSIFVSLVAMVGLTATGNALAHDYSGTLEAAASSTDYFQVVCSDSTTGEDTEYLEVRIKDVTELPGGGKMSAVVVHDTVAKTASDAQRVDRGEGCAGFDDVTKNLAFGPAVQVHGGNAAYRILVHKTKQDRFTTGFAKQYVLEYHCKTANGVHSGTFITVLQDH